MTTPQELIEAIERQMAEQEPQLQAFLAALADCDPRLQFAVAADALLEITPPRRRRPTPLLPMQAIRG